MQRQRMSDHSPCTTHHSPSEEWTLPSRRIGRRVQVYDLLDSTNSLALSLAHDPRHDGLVILALEQTAGRGQYGRSWLAPPASSVLLSALVFPPAALQRPVVLTAWAAVSVCELVGQVTGAPLHIKWPNDIQANGRKVAGILIEQRTAGAEARATVVGIGLNVTQSAAWFEQSGLGQATSLACLAGSTPNTEDMDRRLIGILDAHYDRLLGGDVATLECAWKRHLRVVGKLADLELHNQDGLQGRIRDVAFTAVDVDLGRGRRIALAPERIKQLRPRSD